MSIYYDDEKERAKQARKDFGHYDLEFVASQINGYRTDGDLRWKSFSVAIINMKPELCLGSAEPLLEAAWYYIALTRDHLEANPGSHLPCMILYIAGDCTCLLRHVHHILMFTSQALILALQALFGPIVLTCRS